MPIRGVKSPVPAKKPAKNSGIFSGNGKQKLDPVKRPDVTNRTLNEAYSRKGRKIGSA